MVIRRQVVDLWSVFTKTINGRRVNVGSPTRYMTSHLINARTHVCVCVCVCVHHVQICFEEQVEYVMRIIIIIIINKNKMLFWFIFLYMVVIHASYIQPYPSMICLFVCLFVCFFLHIQYFLFLFFFKKAHSVRVFHH